MTARVLWSLPIAAALILTGTAAAAMETPEPTPPVEVTIYPYGVSARWILPASWPTNVTPTYQAAIFPQDRLPWEDVLPCGRWSQDDDYWIESAEDEQVWLSLGDVLEQGEDHSIYLSHVFTYGGDCPPDDPEPTPEPTLEPTDTPTVATLPDTGQAFNIDAALAIGGLMFVGIALVWFGRRGL